VEFKKIGVVIDKSGAKKQDLSNITMDIDVDCIQVRSCVILGSSQNWQRISW